MSINHIFKDHPCCWGHLLDLGELTFITFSLIKFQEVVYD